MDAYYTILGFIIIAVFVTLILVPIYKILTRAGWSGWLCVLWLIPIVNIVMLWVFAFAPWPALNEQ